MRAPAQEPEPLQPGEAYVTRFSGTSTTDGKPVIDLNGTVGSIVDVRNPSQPPQGHHWLNEPQRHKITAADAGQVFGVALDDAPSPNVYLTATSAFGLHRTADNADWMPGMWGPGGGPGTIWKVSPETGYKPAIFAKIGVNGRTNTGAGLGNIAYDKWNHQFYVSDLETGLIHRLSPDGTDLGQFDQGVTGRASFLDAVTGKQMSLPEVAFDPKSAARITDCSDGDFAKTPSCWNFADFRRRVWGLGVRKDAQSGEVRLYYAIWSSQALGSKDFAPASEEEKRNSIWSVAIKADGTFDSGSVRREYLLPDFFTDPAAIERGGRSNPVSDIAFCKCKDVKTMLVAERGGVRNLGLDAEEPFANPHESRVLAYELDDKGIWQLKGRYDIGHYDRKNDGQPFLRANGSGGVAYGYGYGVEWNIDTARPDQTVWMTGGTLCSPQAPCFSPDLGRAEDGSYVSGAQGTPVGAIERLLPEEATKPYPAAGAPYPATGPLQSYIFDTDNNLDENGNVIMAELTRNDATKVGDIEIYELCEKEEAEGPPLVEEQPELVDETPEIVAPPVIVDTPPDADIPDLETVKTGPAQCLAGAICTFTVTITNRGPGVWSGPLQATDTLPPGATLWNFNPQPDWTCTQAGGAVNCTSAWLTLNPGDAATLTIDVLLPPGAFGPVENCMQTTWLPGRDPNDPAVILALEQALNAAGYQVGVIDGVLDVVTQNGIRQLEADNGLPITGVPDQAVLDLIFAGNAGLPGDGNAANDLSCATVAVLPAGTPPPLAAAPPPPAAPPGAPSDIAVRKDQTIGRCDAGGLCTYRLTFANGGAGDWTGVPEIVDTLPAGATLVASASAVGCSQSGNSVTCRYPQQVTLPPNDQVAATITVRMPATLPPGTQNCAEAGPSIAANDPNAGNNRQCIPVPAAADLQTRKIQRTAECRANALCNFEVWFMNRGPTAWTGVPQIVDILPQGATFVSATAPAICAQSGRRLTCRYPRRITLAPGVRGRLAITVRMPRNLQPGARNCVSIPSGVNPDDSDRANDRQCISVRVAPPPVPDIQVLKTQSTETCAPGQECAFDLWFINRGPGDWTGEPQLSDELPPGAKLKRGSGQWRCKLSGSNLTCSHRKITLPPGRAIKVTVTIELPADLAPNAKNCVRSSGDGNARHDPVPQNNERCITIRTTEAPEPTEPTEPAGEPPVHEGVEPEAPEPVHPEKPEAKEPEHEEPTEPHAPPPAEPADTRVEKKQLGPCKPGHSCLFELKFVNKGPGAWTGRAKLSDLLPDANAKLGSWSPSRWKCKQNGAAIGCEHSGATVAPNEHLSLTMTIKLPEHLHAGAKNCAVLERPDIGPVDPNIIGDRQCVPIDIVTPGFTPRPPAVVQPTTPCPHGTVRKDGQCVTTTLSCPAGYILKGDKCYSTQLSCPAGYVLRGNKCYSTQLTCPKGYVLRGDKCYSTKTTLTCPKGYVLRGKKCYSTQLSCPKGYVLRGRRCYSTQLRCPPGYTLRGRRCYPPVRRYCPPGYVMVGNICVRLGGGGRVPHGHGHGH